MNWVDVAAVISLLAGIAIGLRAGIVAIIATLFGTVVATALAGRFDSDMAGVFSFMPGANGDRIAAFAAIFLAVLIAFEIIGMMVKTLFHLLFVGWIDHIGGAILGLIVAAFLFGALASLLGNFSGGKFKQDVQDSKTAQFLADKTIVIEGLLPSEYQKLNDLRNQRR